MHHSVERFMRSHRGRSAPLAACGLVLVVMLAASACGSATTTTATTASGVTTTRTTAAPTAADPSALVGTKIEATSETPPDFAEALRQQKPIAVLFYTPSGVDDEKVRKSLETLAKTTKGVTFFSYDYRTPSLYGDLSSLLKVGYTPQGVFIDATGVVKNVSSGYLDEGTLKQYLANIRQP